MTRRSRLLQVLLAALFGALVGASLLPLGLWAQGGGCWGSICQTAGGTIRLAGNITANQAISISTSPFGFALPSGAYGFAKVTRDPAAPGPGVGYLLLRGMAGGQCQFFAASGSSAIEVPLGPPFGGNC